MDLQLLPEYYERFLDTPDEEAKWLESIRHRVEELLDKDPGLLFSHLYRLDVEESILSHLLRTQAADQLAEAISREIWKRQKARMQSRRDHPQGLILDSDF